MRDKQTTETLGRSWFLCLKQQGSDLNPRYERLLNITCGEDEVCCGTLLDRSCKKC